MRLFFHLSGEHPDLPWAEVRAVLEGEKVQYSVVFEDGGVLVLDADSPGSAYVKRLALSKKAGKVLAHTGNLIDVALSIRCKVPLHKTVAVRSRSHSLEEDLGGKLSALGYVTDLEEPDARIECFRTGAKYLAGSGIRFERRFNTRRPQFRPYFHPTSMHPKLARVLVNLARVRKGDTVLDPFCGTGGVLIEAGLMGMDYQGSDIDPKMVEGCKKNLESFGLWGDIMEADALNLKGMFGNIDAVVTDPPYARSSFVSERNLEGFYRKFLASAETVLRSGGFLVFMTPKQYIIDYRGFDLVEEFHVRVHKSLTRRITVLRKP
ncbi:MAG: methyltransferase [Candidatus Altiarchaeota archaeon]|nr:methyltransferase [Candidatus Altiarchaeota archaeon]